MYLLSKTSQIPEKFKSKEFIKSLICKYLQINIDGLSTEQRTKLYNKMPLKLRRFKESQPNEKSAKVLKAWLFKYVQQEVANFAKESSPVVKTELKLEESEWKIIDEVYECSSDSNDAKYLNVPTASTSKKESVPEMSTTKASSILIEKLTKEVDKSVLVKDKKIEGQQNLKFLSAFKIPKKTDTSVDNADKNDKIPKLTERSIESKKIDNNNETSSERITQRRSTMAEVQSDKISKANTINKEKETSVENVARAKIKKHRMTLDGHANASEKIQKRRLSVDAHRVKNVQSPVTTKPVEKTDESKEQKKSR